jgi:signal peptide peptidase-like protein 2B
MLLTIPRFLDYQGGASLLGLGDIVLPGLLLSFAARLDAAKALLGGGRAAKSGFWSCCCHGTYFGPLVVAYALGLMMANVAVYVMNMGQPALLYLVPCCLGTMCVLGWRRGELTALWHGPKVVTTADHILYGGVPTDEGLGDAAPMAPSAEDEQP